MRSEREEEASSADAGAVPSSSQTITAPGLPPIEAAGPRAVESRRAGRSGAAGDPLLAACRLVAARLGCTLRSAAGEAGMRRARPGRCLRQLCETAGVRYRKVLLRDDWWRYDHGPLLGFLTSRTARGPELAGGSARVELPVALLPTAPGSYELADPTTGERTKVDAAVAATLAAEAYMLYPPLPRRCALRDLLRLALSGGRRDLLLVAAVGLGGGLLGLLVPIVTGAIYGSLVPGAERLRLLPLLCAVAAAAAGASVFQVVRALGVLRVTSRIDGLVQPAVWDRLLRLPTSFFRRFSAGELADRVLGIDAIRELLLADVTTTFLGLVVSLVSFGLLFYYSPRLAVLAVGLIALLAAAAGVLTRRQLRSQRRLLQVQGALSGLVFGLIHGIAKLRASGTEERAYEKWALLYAEQRRRACEAQRIAHFQAVLTGGYAVFAELALFALMGLTLKGELGLGRFLAFSAAYGQVQAAVLTFISLMPELLPAVPIYERLRPILEAGLEVEESRADAGELAGDIEVSHLSFRYEADAPLVLDDVSLRARPGELVAIVGPSGSGKSTLLRLLLGFERPLSGTVLYDRRSLAALDLGSVRRQIGVVLQDSRPVTCDLYTNIVGAADLGMEAAWDAARMAGIEEDIRAMPMGMHTLISEGATLSGGQQQRLMLARALVGRPRIVFLDEATSALDNPTQEVLRRNLELLAATRIVVAHRLSTIRHADRIYVLNEGRIAEAGTYDELMESGGLFQRLAERQLR